MTDIRKILPMLSALPVFEEAARTSSFTQAAQNLGMAQPSVSRFVSNLEDQLGVKLFVRHHNRILLTPAGEQFFEATKLGLAHIRSAIEALDGSTRSNIINICCSRGFAHMWLMPRRESLLDFLPGHTVNISTVNYTNEVSRDERDIGIVFGDGKLAGKETHLLFDEVVFAVCSPAFAAHHKLLDKPVTQAQIQNLPILVQDRGEMGWMSWQSWFNHFDAEFAFSESEYVFDDYALSLAAAMEGKGIALAWEGLADQYLLNNWLVELGGLKVRTGKGYYLVFSPDNPIANGLRQWLEKSDDVGTAT